jgi:hypothetical protein
MTLLTKIVSGGRRRLAPVLNILLKAVVPFN